MCTGETFRKWREKGRELQNVELDNGYTCQRCQIFLTLQYITNILSNTGNSPYKPFYMKNPRVMLAMGLTMRMLQTIIKTGTNSGIITQVTEPIFSGQSTVSPKFIINQERFLQIASLFIPKNSSKKYVSKINETWLPIRFRITLFNSIPNDINKIYFYNHNLCIKRPETELKIPVKITDFNYEKIDNNTLYYKDGDKIGNYIILNGKHFYINNIYALYYEFYKSNNIIHNSNNIPTKNHIKISLFTYDEMSKFVKGSSYSYTFHCLETNGVNSIQHKNGLILYDIDKYLENYKGTAGSNKAYKECINVFGKSILPKPVTFSSNICNLQDALLGYAKALCENVCVKENQNLTKLIKQKGQYVQNFLKIKVKKNSSGSQFTLYATARQYTKECGLKSQDRKAKLNNNNIIYNLDLHSAAPSMFKLLNTGKFNINLDIKKEMLSWEFTDIYNQELTKDTMKELQMRFLFTPTLKKCWSRYNTASKLKDSIYGLGQNTQIVNRTTFECLWNRFFELMGSKEKTNMYGPSLFLLESTMELEVFNTLLDMGVNTRNVYDCFYFDKYTPENMKYIIEDTILNEYNMLRNYKLLQI